MRSSTISLSAGRKSSELMPEKFETIHFKVNVLFKKYLKIVKKLLPLPE